MLSVNAKDLDHKAINEALRSARQPCSIDSCCGQRFIAAGMKDQDIVIRGVPGNALGAYLNGWKVTVLGNAQDAVGDGVAVAAVPAFRLGQRRLVPPPVERDDVVILHAGTSFVLF